VLTAARRTRVRWTAAAKRDRQDRDGLGAVEGVQTCPGRASFCAAQRGQAGAAVSSRRDISTLAAVECG
jgi:hypothetical protein